MEQKPLNKPTQKTTGRPTTAGAKPTATRRPAAAGAKPTATRRPAAAGAKPTAARRPNNAATKPTTPRKPAPPRTTANTKKTSITHKIKNILNKISSHFLLRNTVLALCLTVVLISMLWLTLNTFTRNGQGYPVPDLRGHNIHTINEYLKKADLKVIIDDSVYIGELAPGTITEQNPKPNSMVKSGRKIFVVINSNTARMAEIPYITGHSLRQAKSILMNKGFTINKLIYRPDMATNNVIGQQYKGKDISKDSKQKAHIGDGITLTIGRRSGDPLPTVPKVVGLTLNEAKGRLIEEGFNIGDIHTTEKINKAKMGSAMVYRQIPGPDVRLDFGAKVTLYLSQDPKLVNSSSQQTDNLLRMAEEEAARNSAN